MARIVGHGPWSVGPWAIVCGTRSGMHLKVVALRSQFASISSTHGAHRVYTLVVEFAQLTKIDPSLTVSL